MFANMGPAPSGRSGHALSAYGKYVLVLGGESNAAFAQPGLVDHSMIHVLDTGEWTLDREGEYRLIIRPQIRQNQVPSREQERRRTRQVPLAIAVRRHTSTSSNVGRIRCNSKHQRPLSVIRRFCRYRHDLERRSGTCIITADNTRGAGTGAATDACDAKDGSSACAWLAAHSRQPRHQRRFSGSSTNSSSSTLSRLRASPGTTTPTTSRRRDVRDGPKSSHVAITDGDRCTTHQRHVLSR